MRSMVEGSSLSGYDPSTAFGGPAPANAGEDNASLSRQPAFSLS